MRTEYNNPHGQGQLGLPYHYEMVSDASRVNPFKKAIKDVCSGKIVLESGVGTGIMSILAAQYGAAHVYAVEIDPEVARIAEQNIKRLGLESKITLIKKDIREVTKEDLGGNLADVVIAENLSTWQVTEPQIQVMNYVNQKLVSDVCVRLPGKISNYVELAHSQYRFHGVDVRTHYFQFSGVKKPTILSGKVLASEINLSQQNPESYEITRRVKVDKNGVLNSVRLTSPIQIYGNIMFQSSDTLMPPVIVPLQKDIRVKKGDEVELTIRYTCNTKWEDFEVSAEKVRQ